jgi:hypothetical protein
MPWPDIRSWRRGPPTNKAENYPGDALGNYTNPNAEFAVQEGNPVRDLTRLQQSTAGGHGWQILTYRDIWMEYLPSLCYSETLA